MLRSSLTTQVLDARGCASKMVVMNQCIQITEEEDPSKQHFSLLILHHVNRIFFFSRLGEQVAVFRAENGKVHVVDAYCPHLGANLAVGGRVLGDCIECPFHGWQFQGSDGKCVKVPYAEKGQ